MRKEQACCGLTGPLTVRDCEPRVATEHRRSVTSCESGYRVSMTAADGSPGQANWSSILPARRRAGPTTIFTSWPSFVTSSSSLASLTPRN